MSRLVALCLVAVTFFPACDLYGQSAVSEDDVIGEDGRLPTPKGLEKDVVFWERIFTKYSPEQCVMHDNWHLDIVYAVKRVPDGSSAMRRRLVRSYVRQIRQALQNLASTGRPRTKLETRVRDAVPTRLRTRSFYLAAQERVRCQRGVDLAPSFARSTRYIPMIKRVLRSKDMPMDLAYLPHLESGFNRYALSHAGAKGLWQFMPATARGEGLKVNKGRRIDYRTNPEKSTHAATEYLIGIHERTGSWPLTVTAYNYGQNGTMRAIRKFGPDYMMVRRFHKTRIFGFAARNYYPSFLAVRNVAMREELADAARERKSGRIADGASVRRPRTGS